MATDLDGTFLESRNPQTDKLYDVIKNAPDDCLLVFVTGRNKEIILPILDDIFIPTPHFIISDVGATVLHGDTLDPVQPIQNEISNRWYETLKDIKNVEGLKNLSRQPIPQERRLSFFATPENFAEEQIQAIKSCKCNVIYSNNMYLDILPYDTSKGSTLKALIDHLGIPQESVIVAGDTLNDLSLFQTGFKGIVPHNAEIHLKEETQELDQVYTSKKSGTDGIFDALEHFGIIKNYNEKIHTSTYGPSKLIMVYHRLPFKLAVENRKKIKKYNPNGVLSTMLNFFRDGEEGTWIAWTPEDETIDMTDDDDYVDRTHFPNLRLKQIPLGHKEIKGFYDGVSRGALWPLIHLFYENSVFNREDWEHYKNVNLRFAEKIAKEAAENATVWLHDYTVWLVPGFLRTMRPDLKILFFHHTYFPPADVFNILPWRREIISSLIECDYIGFHIPHYVENFVNVMKSNYDITIKETKNAAPRYKTFGCAIGADTYTTSIATERHTIHLGAHPVGINCTHVKQLAQSSKVDELCKKIKTEIRTEKCIISVERTDYTKGPVEKLKAYKYFLENHPDMHGEVSLIMISTPASESNADYKKLSQDMAYHVGLINGKFGTCNWQPVRFFSRALPFEEIIAYYKASDVAWVTPLRDGLNLVAKEYVTTKEASDTSGALVLSEFAGAAVELHSAYLVNPYDVHDMSDTLYKALNAPESEKKSRIYRMAKIISDYDVNDWGRDLLNTANSLPARSTSPRGNIVQKDRQRMKDLAA